MKNDYVFKREWPVGSDKPLRIDTVSFEKATVAETVKYFKELVEEYRNVIKIKDSSIKCLTEENEAYSDKELSHMQIDQRIERLEKAIEEKNVVIKYLERKLEKDYDECY